MISSLAFDPTTLTLNVNLMDLTIRGGEAASKLLVNIVLKSCEGDSEKVASLLRSIEDPELRARASHVATAVWHEKRHFLDSILTNFGAIRTRLYFSLYGSHDYLLQGAKANGNVLWAPISVYADPVHRFLKEIPTDWPGQLAESVRDMNEHFERDQHAESTSYGLAERGGDSQLEAIAWICQLANSPILLDSNLAREALQDVRLFGEGLARYRWIEHLSQSLGLVPSQTSGNREVINVAFLTPLLYASLQSRSYGQYKSVPKSDHASLPSERLYRLAQQLDGMNLRDAHFEPVEAWNVVNGLCSDIWGRTALEEMEEDYSREEGYSNALLEDGVTHEAGVCFAEYHALRGTLLSLLSDYPEAIIDPNVYAISVLPRLQPKVLLIDPSGMDKEVPDGLRVVHGCTYTSPAGNDWWWAALSDGWPQTPDGSICLSLGEWHRVASTLSPLAKLMLGGRKCHSMIAPEFHALEQRLAHVGIEVKYDPCFEYPQEDPCEQMDLAYVTAGVDEALCTLCGKVMSRPEGRVLQAWVFRHNNVMVELMLRLLSNGEEIDATGKRGYWKDWSPWICCDACFSSWSDTPAFAAACSATFARPIVDRR